MPFQKGNKLGGGRPSGRQEFAQRFKKWADVPADELLKLDPKKLSSFDALIIKMWQIAFNNPDVSASLKAQNSFIERVAGKVAQPIAGADEEDGYQPISLRWMNDKEE